MNSKSISFVIWSFWAGLTLLALYEVAQYESFTGWVSIVLFWATFVNICMAIKNAKGADLFD